jgi:hypothetical protein
VAGIRKFRKGDEGEEQRAKGEEQRAKRKG